MPAADRARWLALPAAVPLRDRDVAVEYDVEEDEAGGMLAVARLRIPEKVARTLTESELPALDRPLRFVVTRGQRGAARGRTLEELQDALDRPWSEEEVQRDRARPTRREVRRDRVAPKHGRDPGRGGRGPKRGGRGGRRGR